ncbi:MGMT family protein [Roseivirga misakiensis]|uniref:Cysteine methyltransferase n=1 Tax=Roseivirga misakiensis TaxID=1563681 RepID=A0A1E5T5H3_9BACT|nr:MGMT family protein [Roseivirga misakiensis]OEK06632.1 cysteine methyltransferase [Roseivirga misakiensis]
MAKDHTNFFNSVYDVARLIPPGRVTSYGAIAHYLGSKGSARIVGWAMNASGIHEDVPAHRVVNRAGILTGKHHFGTINPMQKRLEAEGVIVVDDKIQNLDQVYWDPTVELAL